MTHKRNTEGLAKAAKQRRVDTIKRVNTVLEIFLKAGNAINFNSISKAAKVGKVWLYNEESIRKKIEELRQKTKTINIQSSSSEIQSSSSKSKRNIIAMLKERVHSVENENKKLKEQIELLYGQLYKLGK